MKSLIAIAALTLSFSAFADGHGHKAGKDAAKTTTTTTTTAPAAAPAVDEAKMKAAMDACKAEKAKDMKACVASKTQAM